MADQPPSNAQFKLPDDLNTLAQMRDQLSDYLNTLERNTDSTNEWLGRNQNIIIVGHHQLNRALAAKDETAALKALADLGDTAGFVLSLQDFDQMGDAAFGASSKFSKAIGKIRRGIPENVLEELPELVVPDADAPLVAPPTIQQPEPDFVPETLKAKKKWWQFGGGDDAPEAEDSEAEAARRIEEIKRNWKLVRNELVSLQSDRHYYIDSFMEWVGETLEPSAETTDAEADRLMEKYQNPQYVIDLAVSDYAEVMDVKARALRNKALKYSESAALIDTQNIAGFVQMLPTLFPKTETLETKQQKDLLLRDFGVISFADLALTKVTSRADQLLLLETALWLEPEFKLTGTKSRREIFDRVFAETMTAQDPLDSRALTLTLKKLREMGGDPAELISLKTAPRTIFDRIAERFTGIMAEARDVMTDVLDGIGAPNRGTETQLHNFVTLTRVPTPTVMLNTLEGIANKKNGQAFKALYKLTYPNRSIVADLTAAADGDKKDLAKLFDKALTAGLLDEFKIETNATAGNAANVIRFFNEQVMKQPGDFPLLTARRLLGASFANGGLDVLRRELTKPNGWLEQVAASPLKAEDKLAWIAGLLEPYASPIVQANILVEAAEDAKGKATAKALLDIEGNLAGANIRLDDGRILTNLDRIANIWYSAEAKTLRFTVGGTSHLLAEDISAPMAQEVLTHIQRKFPGLQPEYDGLYNPANLGRIATTPQGTTIHWQNRAGVLNVPDAQVEALHRDPAFLHIAGKNGVTQSVNLSTIALLQPLSDGSHLLVDKYGDVQVVEGKVTFQPADPLIDLGNGTYFNPKNAGILSIAASKNAIEFRCESKDFESLLDNAAPGQYFYSVPVSSAGGIKAVQDAVKAAPAIATAGGAYDQLFFNFETLGYMMYTEERDAGFNCRKFGPSKKPGFISAEEDMARALFAGLSANKDLVSVGPFITHKSVIDDIYYNGDRQRAYALLGNDLLQIPCDEATAYAALKPLSKEAGFTTVGVSTIANPVKNGVGSAELPADIVNLNRTVLQFYSDAQEKTLLVADNDRFFHIGLDKAQSTRLFDQLDEKGLAAAKAATNAAEDRWTQKLVDAFIRLPQENLPVTPSLTDSTREYLLQQVIGTQGENRDMPKPKADFAIAAKPIKANDNLAYPPQQKAKAAAAMRRPRL